MALDWWESFGYSTVVADMFTSLVVSGVTTTINATGAPGGTPSLRMVGAGGGSTTNGQNIKTLLTSSGTKRFHFYYKTNNLPNSTRIIWKFQQGGSEQVDIRVNTSGDLFFTRNGTTLSNTTVTGAITAGVVVHIRGKIVVHSSTGIIEVYLNGSSDNSTPSATGLNTQATGTAQIDAAGPCFVSSATGDSSTTDHSDIIVDDANDLGESKVRYFPGNANGNSSQWTRSAGSNNFENIDEAGTKDTSNFNHTAGVGDKDTFGSDNVPTTALIHAVCPVGLFDKQDAGAADCCFVIRQGGTDFDGANFSPANGSPGYFKQAFEDNPNTSNPFTPTEFNGGEFGYKRAA